MYGHNLNQSGKAKNKAKYGVVTMIVALVLTMVACGKKDDGPTKEAESVLRVTQITRVGNSSSISGYSNGSMYQNTGFQQNETLLNTTFRVTVADDMNSVTFDVSPNDYIQISADKVGGSYKYRIQSACGDINCVTLAILLQRQRATEAWGAATMAYGDQTSDAYSYRSRGILFLLNANGQLTPSRTADGSYVDLGAALPALGVNAY